MSKKHYQPLAVLVLLLVAASGSYWLGRNQNNDIQRKLQNDEKIITTDNQVLDAMSTCLVYGSVCSYKVLSQLVDSPLKQREELMKVKYRNGNK